MKPWATAAILLLAAPMAWSARRAAMIFAAPAPPPPLRMVLVASVLIFASAIVATAKPWPVSLVLAWALLALATIDLAVFRLPDALTLPLLILGLAIAGCGLSDGGSMITFAPAALVSHLIGAGLGYGAFALISTAYFRLRGRDGLGLGDAKLAACGGAWLGWTALPSMVLIACGVTFAWILVRRIRLGASSLSEPLPLGPALALALWTLWLVPGLAP